MSDRSYAEGRFNAELDAYQARERERAAAAEARSHETAARPDAEPTETTFRDVRVDDYMTADGDRWVRVREVQQDKSKRGKDAPGMVAVLFEIPEPVTVSGETRWWIERPASAAVTVDARVRRQRAS